MSYGTCPHCGANGLSRERRPNGNDTCAVGHKYPSANAIPHPPRLDQLSKAATGGTWYGVDGMVEVVENDVADPACCYAGYYGHKSTPRQEYANATFIAAIVNAYRDGRLVEKETT